MDKQTNGTSVESKNSKQMLASKDWNNSILRINYGHYKILYKTGVGRFIDTLI